MNTTLTPPPTDREREMLAEWVGRFATMHYDSGNFMYGLEECIELAESMLARFRARYGVTGAETEPICEAEITLMDAIRMLHPDKTLTIYDSDCMGVITHDSGVGEWPFNSLPELIEILKGGPHETR